MSRNGTALGVGLLVTTVGLAGCAGSSGPAGQGASAATVAQWCTTFRAAQAKANLINSAPDPTAAGAIATDARAATQKAVDQAPTEVRSDMATVAQVLDDSLAAWQRQHFSRSAMADPRSLVDPSELSRGEAAAQRLATYVASHC